MARMIQRGLLVLALFLSPLSLFALDQEKLVPGAGPDDLYQGALQAYLAGDLDQAILLDSKALQLNPQFQKAEALLSVLVSEKDTARKTVIWIGGKPATVEQAPALPPPAPVTVLKERVITRTESAPRLDSQKLAELESRVQMVAFLLERDSFNQYHELAGAQAQSAKRLDEIAQSVKDMGRGMGLSNFLFLLALVVACLALWKSWRTSRELESRLRGGEGSGGSGDRKVVNFR